MPLNNLALIFFHSFGRKQATNRIHARPDLVARLDRWLEISSGEGILHRDLKLENVLLFDNCRIAKIADFGCAKAMHHSANTPLTDLPYGPNDLLQGDFFYFYIM